VRTATLDTSMAKHPCYAATEGCRDVRALVEKGGASVDVRDDEDRAVID